MALILLGILGHLDDYGAARSIVSQLMSALPAGSYLVIADGVADRVADGVADGVAANPGTGSAQRRYERARSRYGARVPAPYVLRRPDELASFFDGLDLIEPGVVPCPQWRPDGRGSDGRGSDGRGSDGRGADGRGPDGAADHAAAAYCGVARKS